jgi:hypothetical protein
MAEDNITATSSPNGSKRKASDTKAVLRTLLNKMESLNVQFERSLKALAVTSTTLTIQMIPSSLPKRFQTILKASSNTPTYRFTSGQRQLPVLSTLGIEYYARPQRSPLLNVGTRNDRT